MIMIIFMILWFCGQGKMRQIVRDSLLRATWSSSWKIYFHSLYTTDITSSARGNLQACLQIQHPLQVLEFCSSLSNFCP